VSSSLSPEAHPWKTQDPYQKELDRKGMLLSNQIHRFCTEARLLISENYTETRLQPAAYTLTIGSKYVDSNGKGGVLSKKNPSFVMEENSIVYVSTAESLDLPYYIAARFNLRVTWVYKGILLGTGPQVEPGFRGPLSCPLFNLTNRPVTITLGQEFATIDFERTTNFPDKGPAEVAASMSDNGKLEQVIVGGEKFLLFKQRAFTALEKYPDYGIVSSLVEMSKEVKTWRNIGIGIVISFFALTLTILGLQNNLLREVIAGSKDAAQNRQEISNTRTEVQRLQQQLDDLKKSASATGKGEKGP
jgi:deoxycytidine triphosphate deaminase